MWGGGGGAGSRLMEAGREEAAARIYMLAGYHREALQVTLA